LSERREEAQEKRSVTLFGGEGGGRHPLQKEGSVGHWDADRERRKELRKAERGEWKGKKDAAQITYPVRRGGKGNLQGKGGRPDWTKGGAVTGGGGGKKGTPTRKPPEKEKKKRREKPPRSKSPCLRRHQMGTRGKG